MNLLEVLTAEDKDLIKAYIESYGTIPGVFCGVDKYLETWAKNKKKMYKLFGNKLQIKVQLSHKKSQAEIIDQMNDVVKEHSDFANNFSSKIIPQLGIDIFETDFFWLRTILRPQVLASNQIDESLKIKRGGKSLTLQKGTKPIRAIGKIINFCSFYRTTLSEEDLLISDDDFKKIEEQFESFRISHSMVTNKDIQAANLVLSIHPMDYFTMSDNACGWTSCMSWIQDGCYRAGTIEMLNSNNVICCYIEAANKKLSFSENKFWNSKQWRQLVYVTKDIAVGGKAYPYQSKEFTLKILDIIQELSKSNFNNSYKYGPEKYLDMMTINDNFDFRSAIEQDKNKKKIIFDTKIMYNDMLNDSGTEYWCIRNKVDKLKTISYSGKANCLCCNKPTLVKEDWLDGEDYNNRYENSSSRNHFLCQECFQNNSCNICDREISKDNLIFL